MTLFAYRSSFREYKQTRTGPHRLLPVISAVPDPPIAQGGVRRPESLERDNRYECIRPLLLCGSLYTSVE